MFSLKEFHYIALLHQHKSFSKAAAAAGITQPALSAAISKIEERINTTLFYRDSHVVTATYLGEFLAQRARKLVNEVSDIERSVDYLRDKRRGSVRFGVGNIIADTMMFDALRKFRSRHAEIAPQFMIGYWYDLRERLLQGDIAFFITASHQPVSDDQIVERLFHRQEIVFFARPGHPLFMKKEVHCSDIVEFPLITYQTIIARKLVRERLDSEVKIRTFEQNFPAGTVESLAVTLPLVLHSDYMLMGPKGLFPEQIAAGRLSELAVADFELTLEVKTVRRAKTLLAPLEEELIACLEESRDRTLRPVSKATT